MSVDALDFAHLPASEPIIRRARPDDLDLLLEMNAEYCVADGHVVAPAIARAGLDPLLRDDTHGSVWIIKRPDGVDDGYAVLARSWSVEVGGEEWVLDEVYVRTRRQGLGGRAIDALLEECRQRGVKRVFLETERPNEAARRLYARHGFEADDSIWMSRHL